MLQTQALVIGGGPSGSTTARFLSENGIDTILVERDINYTKPCGGGIPSTALEEFNIQDDIVKKEIKVLKIVSPKGEEISIRLKGGHICIVERGGFDARLRDISKDKGATLIEAEFLGFERIGKKIISVLRKRKTNEELRIKSDYVVASDGITFRVGSAIKLQKPACIHTLSAHIKPVVPINSPVKKKEGEDDECEFWFGSEYASSFYSWVFPSKEYLSVGTGNIKPSELTMLLNRFIKKRFNLQHIDNAWKTRAFKIPLWSNTIFNIKNILFTGDAAGTVMPVTYEGIYYAMKSGEFAARAIIEGNPEVYKKLWNSRFKNRFLLMNNVRKYLFRNDETIEKWIALHKRPDVQEIAMRLWLRKEKGSSSLLSYIKFFKHLLKT